MPASQSRTPILPRLAGALAIVAAIASLLTLAGPSPAHAAQQAVQIVDSSFSPGTLTVAVGETVTWTNADDRPHTITSNDGAFDSGNLDDGQAFSFTFTEPGTYSYRCSYHPEMQATIVVEAPSIQSSTASQASGASTDEPPSGVGDAAAPASHAAGTHSGEQPNTALAAPASYAWLAPLLIGLGLLSLAFGVIPPAGLSEAPATVERRD